MAPIRCRWHDAGVLGVPPGTPGKQAAAAFALYGVRLQAQGISPGPVEATVTITDQHGHLIGQLDLDAGDAQFMLNASAACSTAPTARGAARTPIACWPATAPGRPRKK